MSAHEPLSQNVSASNQQQPDAPGGAGGDWRTQMHDKLRRSTSLAEQQAHLSPLNRKDAPYGVNQTVPDLSMDREELPEHLAEVLKPDARYDKDRSQASDEAIGEGEEKSGLKKAKTYNNRHRHPVDFVRKVERRLGVAEQDLTTNGIISLAICQRISDFQQQNGIEPVVPIRKTVRGRKKWVRQVTYGALEEKTRLAMEAAWPELQAQLIGEHRDPRILVPGGATPEARYALYAGWIRQQGGHVDDTVGRINLLGIRGVAVSNENGGLQLKQTASAGDYAHGYDAKHFHGDKLDDVIISISIGPDKKPVVQERVGTVDPNMFWSKDHDRKKSQKEGSSHLMDGQYVYRMGHHTTSHHPDDIREYAKEENPTIKPDKRGHVKDPTLGNTRSKWKKIEGKKGLYKERYRALQPVSEQVMRDDFTSDDHTISEEEFQASMARVRKRDRRYVGTDIGTNIHSSQKGGASSLGCMNIPLDEGYAQFIGEVYGSQDTVAQNMKTGLPENQELKKDELLFTLVDASKLQLPSS